MAEEAVDDLVGRRGWQIDGARATFRPVDGGWSDQVRWVVPIGHTYSKWFATVIDPAGRAVHTKTFGRLADARIYAEVQVRGRNAAP
jgi:hypothetical protein